MRSITVDALVSDALRLGLLNAMVPTTVTEAHAICQNDWLFPILSVFACLLSDQASDLGRNGLEGHKQERQEGEGPH